MRREFESVTFACRAAGIQGQKFCCCITRLQGGFFLGLFPLPGAEGVREDEGRISLTLASDAVAVALPRLAELGVEGLRVAPPSLEELFLRHYGASDAPGEGTRR